MTSDNAFEQLADALDRLPNGFPRTPTGVEVRILKKIFSPEEAHLASQMTGKFEQVDEISKRIEMPVEDIKKLLFQMLRRGLVWYEKIEGARCFRLAPFVVGLYEAQLDLMDHELAHLVEDYMTNGGAAGIMKPQPALHRVLPAQDTVKTEWILPYEDVRAILMAAKTYSVRDCICRVEQEYLGRRCEYPVHMCLSFSNLERSPQEGDISREEALEVLNRSEEVGLVHTVSNVMKDIGYVCNCCSCCCGILRGITDFGIQNSVAYANYYAVIDPELCVGCGDCIERCQVHAISDAGGVSVVDRDRCIGCGLCVSGCPNDVARLERRPEAERIQPPADFAAWEHERLVNRGLIE
jgi:H+/Na+-translocating ferredoxin:NAD+ oxidoreductase subunit B